MADQSLLNIVCVCLRTVSARVNEQKWAIWDIAGNNNIGNAGIVEGHRLELGHALDAVLGSEDETLAVTSRPQVGKIWSSIWPQVIGKLLREGA